MTESAFYFILKVLFILNILILNMYKSGLIVKIGLISNFLTSQPGSQTIAIHKSSNISRKSDNQTMKFGQSIEYNMRNIYVE